MSAVQCESELPVCGMDERNRIDLESSPSEVVGFVRDMERTGQAVTLNVWLIPHILSQGQRCLP